MKFFNFCQDKKVKIRVFGSDSCPQCEKLIKELNKYNVNHIFVDANAVDTQKLCDSHNVNKLPHIQILSDDGTVIKEGTGYTPVPKLLKTMHDLS